MGEERGIGTELTEEEEIQSTIYIYMATGDKMYERANDSSIDYSLDPSPLLYLSVFSGERP